MFGKNSPKVSEHFIISIVIVDLGVKHRDVQVFGLCQSHQFLGGGHIILAGVVHGHDRIGINKAVELVFIQPGIFGKGGFQFL